MKCKWLNRFIREEKGQSLVFFAIALTVLLGVTAFAVDIGYLQWQKGQLQNTADAAALAGAREFVDGEIDEIENVVEDYVEEHGIESSEIEDIDVDEENSRVTVELRGNRDLFFAKVLGFMDTDIAVMARGVVGPTGAMEGVIPIGIKKETLEGLEAADLIILSKNNFGNWSDYDSDNPMGPGNWGWVNLDADTVNARPEDQAKYVTGEKEANIKLYDIIHTDPGAAETSMGIWGTKIRDALTEYSAEDTWHFIPVICDEVDSAGGGPPGRYAVEVVGFAAINIIYAEGNPAHFEIEAEYDPGRSIFAGGMPDHSITGYNVKSLALDR